MILRAATPADFPALAAIAEAAYRQAFAAILTPETLACFDRPFFAARFALERRVPVVATDGDGTALGFNAHGGVGCISVTANVAPKLCAEFQAATLAGDYRKALEYQDRLMPLHEAIFLEPGLAGAKYGLSLLGRCSEEVRLPLVGLTDTTKARIKAAMEHAGIL